MNAFKKMGTAIFQFEKWLIIIILTVIFLLSFAQVVMRYLFNMGAAWIPEIIVFCFIIVTLAGTSTGVISGVHIGVDVLVKNLPGKVKWYLNIFVSICGLFLYAFICYVTYEFVMYFKDMGQVSIVTEIPIWITISYIPFSFAFTAFHYLELLVKQLQQKTGVEEESVMMETRW
jgi:C4-dicarboxylate transporter DctQ subunit